MSYIIPSELPDSAHGAYCDRRHDTACLFIRLHKCMYLRGIGNLYMHYENVLLSVWIRRGNIFGKASPVGIRPCFKKDRLATA